MGKKVIFLPSCHSTNDEAADMLNKSKIIDGTIIITDDQTAGKGQRGNRWITTPGNNLTFSLILKPTFLPIVHQFHLNIITSLAIVDCLNSYKPGFQVKWPNDIYFYDRKICGILIQNSIKGTVIENSIIGIGLNVNQEHFADDKPISLIQIINKSTPLNEVLSSVNEHLERRYFQLKRGEIEPLRNDYINMMYRFGEDHLYKAESVFQGRITNITDQGLLELQTDQGFRHFNFKEVEFVA